MARSDSRTSSAEAPEADDRQSSSAATGLTSEEAVRLRQTHGPNRTPAPAPRRLHTRVAVQLRDPMILLLLAAGGLTAVLHDVSDSVIIGAVVFFNTVVGVVQEVRADRAIAALDALTTPTTRVVRDGLPVEVSSEDVVPGDLAVLSAGDVVPADGIVAAGRLLEVDQSTMTGESVPVALVDGDEISGGTLVTRGRADVTITATGADSGLGRLATMIAAAPTRATPLQRRLTELSRVLVLGVGVLTGVVVVIGLLQDRPVTEMAIVGVSLAVAAVPESLPAVVAVSLALGAHRMARRNAVVRRLPAVETLGSVTVIATDKTGTITEGRMVAQAVWTPSGAYVVEAHGYEPRGALVLQEGPTPGGGGSTRELDRLLRDVMLCNDARLVCDEVGWSVVGDPLEGALLALARKGGRDALEADRDWMRVDEEPFDHLTRRMTTVHRDREGVWLTVCKGAPEAVLTLLPASDDVRRAADAAEELARNGYRVIAVADQEGGGGPAPQPRSLELVGLVGIEDPPRDHAAAVVAACRRAGIRLLLVTGDHPATARAIAERVGIAPRGVDVDPEDRTVFSRVRPEEKVAIVRTLQRDGDVVAMIGDGVNDAPALRTADIGVAAGLGGTEVARQAADLVLMDDDLSTVVSAVEEGRRIFANIRSFLLYAVSGGLAEVGVMLLGPAVGIDQPLLPAQILWINLMTHGLTGVAFGSEPADPADMARPPRSPTRSVFTPRFSANLALAAAALMITALGVGLLTDGGVHHQRTAIFLTLGLGQLAVAWAIRARTRGRLRRAPWLGAAIATAGALLVSATLLTPLQELLRTRSLGTHDLVVALVAAVVPGAVVAFRIRAERKALLVTADPRSGDSATY